MRQAEDPGKLGVLIVDDERANRILLGTALRREGYRVFEACNGRDALRIHAQHSDNIDVVLLDNHMPGLDGPATLWLLQSTDPHVRCFFMSGDLDDAEETDLLMRRSEGIIPKPCDIKRVLETLRCQQLHADML